MPSPSLKRRIREALIVPDYWPAIRGIRLMSNGEVWFVPLAEDGSTVWYTARRGRTEGSIRRIVLPDQFNPRDCQRNPRLRRALRRAGGEVRRGAKARALRGKWLKAPVPMWWSGVGPAARRPVIFVTSRTKSPGSSDGKRIGQGVPP